MKIAFIFFFLSSVYASINIEDAPLGEKRLDIKANDYQILIQYSETHQQSVKAYLDKGSVEWIRVKKNLLIPRARLKLFLEAETSKLSLKYKDKIYSFQGSSDKAFAEIYVSLFEKDKAYLFKDGKLYASITLKPKLLEKPKTLIDYTCSRNSISIEGLENEHFTIGCSLKRIGKFGEEKPMLEIMWMSPELRVLEDETVPYFAAFLVQYPINIQVQNIYTKEIKTITIKANIPKRLHRLFTAYGFGPYAFNTKHTNDSGETLTEKVDMATALFFYLNYKISENNSIRGFDAAVFNKSKFNNAGIYLGSDFGFALDNKLYFTTLIGMQYLYFKFDDESDEVSEAIFPQGIEFMYRHAFGIPNYIVSGGVFLSTTDAIEYENAWIRWGKNYFWELNLISWAKDNVEARTWGVSLGFPFKGFL